MRSRATVPGSPSTAGAVVPVDAAYIEIAETGTRRDTDPHGHEITIRDAVLKARKRP